MYSISELTDLSREELYSVISGLKRENNCLETDLIQLKLLLKCYEKYFDFFNEMNEKITTNEEILYLINRLKALKYFTENSDNCFVFVENERIAEKESNRQKPEKILSKIITKLKDMWTQTEVKEISLEFTDNSNIKPNLLDQIEDNDSDFDANEEPMNDNSDEEWNESEVKSNKKLRKGFVCDVFGCEYRTNRRVYLTDHKKRHSNGYEIKCCVKGCHQLFSRQKYLTDHQRKAHQNCSELTYTCKLDNCSVVLKTYKQFMIHKKSHGLSSAIKEVSTDSTKYVCDHIGCGKEFLKRQNLSIHKKAHKGLRYRCEREGCSSVYLTKDSLRAHMNRHKGRYRCDWTDCQFSGTSSHSLANHKMTHSKDRPFKCLINDCNKTYKNQRHLQSHQKIVHPLELSDIPWLCCQEKDCQFKTKCSAKWSNHKNNYHIRPHVCSVCEKRFLTSRHLIRHGSVHNGNHVLCDWPECGKLFSNKDIMKEHLNTHTLKEVFTCEWPGCDKSFLICGSLRTHVSRAHRERPELCCSVCQYRSSTPSLLKSHLKKHENQTKAQNN